MPLPACQGWLLWPASTTSRHRPACSCPPALLPTGAAHRGLSTGAPGTRLAEENEGDSPRPGFKDGQQGQEKPRAGSCKDLSAKGRHVALRPGLPTCKTPEVWTFTLSRTIRALRGNKTLAPCGHRAHSELPPFSTYRLGVVPGTSGQGNLPSQLQLSLTGCQSGPLLLHLQPRAISLIDNQATWLLYPSTGP